MKSNPLLPALVIPFIAWRIYARARRNIGRQALRPGRLLARVIIFAVATAALAVVAAGYPASLVALAGGVAFGAALAFFGLHLTRFETTDEGGFYTPNTTIGIAVTLLLVGRIAYRMTVLLAAPPMDGRPVPPLFQSPLTFSVFGITAGYYIAYYAGILIRSKRAAASVDGGS